MDEIDNPSGIVDSYDPGFENQIYACYGVRIFPDRDEVQFQVDKKTIRRVRKSSFPTSIDLNDVAVISTLMKELRTEGHDAVIKRLKLKEF